MDKSIDWLNWFSFAALLIGAITSLFLHADIVHIGGNRSRSVSFVVTVPRRMTALRSDGSTEV